MPKSYVIAAFPNNSGGPPIIKQYSPLPAYSTPKLGTGLNVTRSAVEITTNAAGTVLISLLFTLALPDNVSQHYHIWDKGPYADAYPPYVLSHHAVGNSYASVIDFSSGIAPRRRPRSKDTARQSCDQCTLPWGLPTSNGVTTIKAGTTIQRTSWEGALQPQRDWLRPRKERAKQALLWTTVSLVKMDVTRCDLPGDLPPHRHRKSKRILLGRGL
eukprot:SM000191S05246  [mRNA]  locus=s191:150115:153073:- [translate_table: standard]